MFDCDVALLAFAIEKPQYEIRYFPAVINLRLHRIDAQLAPATAPGVFTQQKVAIRDAKLFTGVQRRGHKFGEVVLFLATAH